MILRKISIIEDIKIQKPKCCIKLPPPSKKSKIWNQKKIDLTTPRKSKMPSP
jgi:hypothetical protein